MTRTGETHSTSSAPLRLPGNVEKQDSAALTNNYTGIPHQIFSVLDFEGAPTLHGMPLAPFESPSSYSHNIYGPRKIPRRVVQLGRCSFSATARHILKW